MKKAAPGHDGGHVFQQKPAAQAAGFLLSGQPGLTG
jgi:hypothetical protein